MKILAFFCDFWYNEQVFRFTLSILRGIIIMRGIVPGKEKIMTKVKVKKLDERAVLPVYGSEAAAGADLYAVTDGDVTFLPGETKICVYTARATR